jgi:hypothetical protein
MQRPGVVHCSAARRSDTLMLPLYLALTPTGVDN